MRIALLQLNQIVGDQQEDAARIRAGVLKVRGLTVITDDATELSAFGAGSIKSLSILNAAEHFGDDPGH